MLALSVDVGYSMRKHDELQRAADLAALAGARHLVPDVVGNQDIELVRAKIQETAQSRLSDLDGFTVLDDDITIGRYDTATAYTNFTIKSNGVFDTVRVTLRRDESANNPLPLFFGGIFGIVESEAMATATAVVQRPVAIRPGADILPFAIPAEVWLNEDAETPLSLRSDGKIVNAKGQVLAKDWGTIDFGTRRNEAANLNYQVLNGLHESHMTELYRDGRIQIRSTIDSRQEIWVRAKAGLPQELTDTIPLIEEKARLVPLYTQSFGDGRELEFKIVDWVVVAFKRTSSQNSDDIMLEVRPSYLYDGLLRPCQDLCAEEGLIVGAYTSPVLID
ncbi:MAG: pilus assembly protein TadG-related protein [Rubripirellula sp.]|nr:pilus assembly protein TadG-related protein [Rubripirellula sp.]